MTENERVKYLRETILPQRNGRRVSQDTFVEGLGIKKSALSLIESGRNSLSDSVRLLICNKYNVREEWLRDGSGDVFVEKSVEDELTDLAEKVMADTPDSFRRRFVTMLAKLTDDQWKLLSEMESMLLSSAGSDKDSTAQLHADLDHEIALQKKQAARSTGSDFMPASKIRKSGEIESVI